MRYYPSSHRPMSGKRLGQPQEEIPFNVQDKFDNVFLDNHIFFLSGEINEENVLKATQWLVYENAQNEPEKLLQLYINSTGGDLYQALGLIDIMRISKSRIRTIGVGAVMSAAFLIFASGEKGERLISRNCGLMCHQYSDTYEGKHHDLKSFTKEAELTNQRMLNILQEATGMSARDVKSKLLSPSDVWMSAEEVIKLGVADRIL